MEILRGITGIIMSHKYIIYYTKYNKNKIYMETRSSNIQVQQSMFY